VVGPLQSAQLVKLIRVMLRPGHREDYLESQAVWNRESRPAPGYMGEFIGEGDPNDLLVLTFWRSRADYERWMDAEHDRIAALAGAEAHYERIDVRIIDGVEGRG